MFWKKKKPEISKKLTREQIMTQAKANVAQARHDIGDETLDKIKAAMNKRENSPLEQAKKQVKTMNEDKVRDNIALWLKGID